MGKHYKRWCGFTEWKSNFGPPRHRRDVVSVAASARLICAQVRNKPPSLAMGERLEQAIASLKACRAAPSLPENKKKEVDIALKAAKDYQLRTCEACKQQ